MTCLQCYRRVPPQDVSFAISLAPLTPVTTCIALAHVVRQGEIDDDGTMTRIWRCFHSIKPALTRRCFSVTTRRREIRDLAELPERVYSTIKGGSYIRYRESMVMELMYL